MTPDEQTRVLATFAAFKGFPATPEERHEFTCEFGPARFEAVDQAIRESARATGRVTLASVAERMTRIRDEQLRTAITERDAAKRLGAMEPTSPGWPVAPGSSVATYLQALVLFSLETKAQAARYAARYTKGGFLLREHAEAVVGAMWARPSATMRERDTAGAAAVAAIEAKLGNWANCKAEMFVAQFGPAREPGEDDA